MLRVMALLAAMLAPAGGAWSQNAQGAGFNWDALGTEFCRLIVAGDLAVMRPVLTESLATLIQTTVARRGVQGVDPGRVFQSFSNPAPVCEARTRNAALIEVTRRGPDGAVWVDLLVVVPERDGASRIDDVLFATRRSDTLRARLEALIRGG